ncbi:MAG TPA: VIT domain-containing protein [Candidatus Sumerlaeota bacterium]|nr:VIT domain-containing protein [Candidatus Sumerlaeota bacterium]HON49964.1 VIT domain-containing protein [Candidatus Sumerlaeota bacterium]HOR63788.1 VIT domain-containing protein [Candidatus Sumerlaeota bacterium]HPL74460.1 VIT domain-containing protein [Candidatus Sumerlaeota bacterium]HRU53802.1 VIT domain-containing protein [Candidatus Sumerlaeia bacterium]
MKANIVRCALVVSFLLLAALIFGDGVLIVGHPIIASDVYREPSLPKPEALPVKYHHVTVEINNQVATTKIDQVFLNPHNIILEGTYIFPLPEEAAISDFALYMDGLKVSGDVLEKDKARRIYEDIVRRMKDPGLLEYIGRNMFQARIYPIPAKGERRIELTYHQTLKSDSGVIQYVYPLNTERFSPKPLEEVSLSVKINSPIPIKNVYSPSHDVDVKIEKNEAACGFEQKNIKPDKDFVLYYTVSEKDLGLNLLAHCNKGEKGYFMMLLSPGKIDEPAHEKDIVFVLDTSGSMQGKKIEQARNALKFCLQSLKNGDRFGVISFATVVNAFKTALIDATDANKEEALKFVDGFQARGGTDINGALIQALQMFPESKRPRMVVFLTDGEPTIGVTGKEDIIKYVLDANRAKARIFVFGVGTDVNTVLLDKIAEDNRGVPEYILPDENIEIKVSSFYDKISEPVMADLSLDFGKINTSEIYPQVLPDLFHGTQLTVFGRYTGDGATAITLNGYIGNKKQTFVFENKFPESEQKNDFIPRLWASRKIGYLLSEVRLKGDNKELVDEIIRLSREFGIMTPYTSFLVIDKDEAPQTSDFVGRASRVPQSIMSAPTSERQRESFSKAMSYEVGREAMDVSKSIYQLRAKRIDESPSAENAEIKHIGSKTFYLKNGFWIDSAFKDNMKFKELKYLSEEYFALLKAKPALAKYLAAAEKMIIVFEGKCYKITE